MNIFIAIVKWMEASWLGVAAREIYWVFPLAEIIHFFGLCLLMGSILVVDLRLLGFVKRMPIKAALQLTNIAIIGIALNFLSGIVFLCAYPENYWPNLAFWLKLIAIVVGGVNALWFKWMELPKIEKISDSSDTDARTKCVALLSISVWTIVIIIGRFLPFVSVSSS